MTSRFVARGPNPFAPIAKQRNQALTTPRNGIYERLEDRVATMLSDPDAATVELDSMSPAPRATRRAAMLNVEFDWI